MDTSLSEELDIDKVAGAYEAAWQSGIRPDPADFLGRLKPSARAKLLEELVALDVHYLKERDQEIEKADLLRQYQKQYAPLLEDETTLLNGEIAEGFLLSSVHQYRLVTEIGKGGMGVVWRAKDIATKRNVAIKLFNEKADTGYIDRFLLEARSAAELNHPNIVSIYDLQPAGRPFFVMELLRGDLGAELKKDGPLPWEEATRAIRDAARGLAAAHTAGMTHRDIKPSNLLRTDRDDVKVADFGLVQSPGSPRVTVTGAVMGTPGYMSPEQYLGKADVRSDVYSLGCTYFHLLTGRLPFEVPKQSEISRQPIEAPFPHPLQYVADLPEAVSQVVIKACQKDPADRFEDAVEMLDRLEALAKLPPSPSPELKGEPLRVLICAPEDVADLKVLAGNIVCRLANEYARRIKIELVALHNGAAASAHSLQHRINRPRESHIMVGIFWCRLDAGKGEFEDAGQARGKSSGPDLLLYRKTADALVDVKNPAADLSSLLQVKALNDFVDKWRSRGADGQQGTYHDFASDTEFERLLEADLKPLIERRIPEELNGIEWQLAQRAEETFSALGEEVRTALPLVLRKLLTVENGRVAPRLQANSADAWPPNAKTLMDAFVGVGLLSIEQTDQKQEVIRISHEAIFQKWQPAIDWIERNGELLVIRARVEAAASLWAAKEKSPEFLLRSGKPLEEAEGYALKWKDESPEAHALIEASRAQRVILRRLKRGIIAALVCLTLLTGYAAMYAHWQAAIAQANARKAEITIAEGLVLQGDSLVMTGRLFEANLLYQQAYGKFKELDVSPWKAEAALVSLYDLSPPALLTIPAHNATVRCVAVSADGLTAISASSDKTLKSWDLRTGCNIHTFTGHTEAVTSVALSDDGCTALSGSEDQTLRVWDVRAGRERRVLRGHAGKVSSVALSADGRTGLSANWDNTLKVWNVATGDEIRTLGGQSGLVWSVAMTTDGHTAISGNDDGTLKVWDLQTGQEIRTLGEHGRALLSVALSKDGSLALSGGNDNLLKLWDLRTGQEIHAMEGHADNVTSVAISPDGRIGISGSKDNQIKVWDLQTGRPLRTYQGHSDNVCSVALFRDGRTVLSGSADKTLKLWDLQPSREIRTLYGHTDAVRSVALGVDGLTVISGSSDKTLKLWDIPTGRLIYSLSGHKDAVNSVALSEDGRTAVSGSNDTTVKVWDVQTGQEKSTLNGHTAGVLCVAVSPDGAKALSGSGALAYSTENRLIYWDLRENRKLWVQNAHDDAILSVAISRDGNAALSGSADHTVKLWDLPNHGLIRTFEGHTKGVSGAVLFADGAKATTGSLDCTLRLWSLQGKGDNKTIKCGDKHWITGIALSRDGEIAVSASDDHTLKLWDLRAGREVRTLLGHAKEVLGVAISPDGRTVVSASADNTLKVWDFSRASTYETFESLLPESLRRLREDGREKPPDPTALAVLGNWYAFRGRNDWAVELLQEARKSGALIDPLTLARCYWELSADAPVQGQPSTLCFLIAAQREFSAARDAAKADDERRYCTLCLTAIARSIGEAKTKNETAAH